MKVTALTFLILLSCLAAPFSTYGQSWRLTAIHYNYAPFNDSIGDYFPWQESWIDCEIPITCDSIGKDLDPPLLHIGSKS